MRNLEHCLAREGTIPILEIIYDHQFQELSIPFVL